MHFQMDHSVSVLHACIPIVYQFVVKTFWFISILDPNENLVIVLRELDGITNWKWLGLLLGLSDTTLNEIEATEPDTSHCKMAMLHYWLSLRDGVKDKGGATKAVPGQSIVHHGGKRPCTQNRDKGIQFLSLPCPHM